MYAVGCVNLGESASEKEPLQPLAFLSMQGQGAAVCCWGTFAFSMIFKGSVIYVVVSSPQCGENTAFFSGFPLGGIYR